MRRAVFLINLLQDVNVARPLASLAHELGMEVAFLVSEKFNKRDRTGVWGREIEALARRLAASRTTYDSAWSAYRSLSGGQGVLVAASESDLVAHAETHDVLRAAPSGYLRITLQHGYECVGFLHNRDHDRAHGRAITFAADVVAGWTPLQAQRSMVASERSKYLFTGPTSLIPLSAEEARRAPMGAEGVICENLHSVRFGDDGTARDAFTEMFDAFALGMAGAGKSFALRPHPGAKRAFDAGAGAEAVTVAADPIYKLDLSAFRYGVSPPSSVVIDMLLAGLPTAVWCDPGRAMDIGNYAGLHVVGTPGDLFEFRRQALASPDAFRERQEQFLRNSGLLTDPVVVRRRFEDLLLARAQVRVSTQSLEHRVVVVCDSVGATQTISFARPLAHRPDIALKLNGDDPSMADRHRLAARWPSSGAPTALVLSRYTGKAGPALIDKARREGTPVIFHLDDDLLAVPESLGPAKFAHYNHPDRLAALRAMLEASDLVYASTPALGARLKAHGVTAPIVEGDIYCAMQADRAFIPQRSPQPTIGYMATGGHGADLDLVTPAIERLLDRNPRLRFETFGRVSPPAALRRFGDRVAQRDGEPDYDAFLAKLAGLGWWVGIAPLEDTPFNRCKADTKWVEYTFAGIPTVASDLGVYTQACAGGAGLLARDDEGWERALARLIGQPTFAEKTLALARERLASRYSLERLAAQVIDVLATARRHSGARTAAEPELMEIAD